MSPEEPSSAQEGPNLLLGALLELLGRAPGDHGLAFRIEEHSVISQLEDAGQFVGHEDQVVQAARAERIEARRGLVEV